MNQIKKFVYIKVVPGVYWFIFFLFCVLSLLLKDFYDQIVCLLMALGTLWTMRQYQKLLTTLNLED